MSAGFWVIRRLVKMRSPTRLWSLQELARETGLPLTETKDAVAQLVDGGELIPKGGEHYARPAREAHEE